MKTKSFVCYNVLMDKKSVVRKRFNYKTKAKCALITGIVLGLILICVSAVQLYTYHRERGDKTLEELQAQIDELSVEEQKYETIIYKELADNDGKSDEYVDATNKWAEVATKKTSAENSVYMINTGYHNPRNLWELLLVSPLLFVGVLCFVAGFIAKSIIIEKGKKEEAEKAEAKK